MKIEIVSGSPRKHSVSIRIAKFLQKFLKENTEHDVNIIDVRDWELNFLQEVFSSKEKAPDHLKILAEHMFNANAFILVSPEFNGSYTGALKNLFDHFPKQLHKIFGIVTSSTGAFGGIRAAQQLQLLISGLFGISSPHMLITPFTDNKFDAVGHLIDPDFQKNIDVFLTEFLWIAENLTSKMHAVV